MAEGRVRGYLCVNERHARRRIAACSWRFESNPPSGLRPPSGEGGHHAAAHVAQDPLSGPFGELRAGSTAFRAAQAFSAPHIQKNSLLPRPRRTDRRVHVSTQAGKLEVAWPEGGEVWLTGPIQKVMEGKYVYRGSP